MVIKISYNKQTWNEYNDSQTADENLANGAIISADRLNHMETGISNNDTNKVTDNKDGTEQLNGVQVQPYNKLSDVTNLRNIVLQTDNVIPHTAKGGVGETIQDFPIYSGFSSLPSGTQVYYSYDLVVNNADGGIHWFGWGSPWDAFISNKRITKDGIHHFQGTTTNIPDVNSKQWIHSTIDNSHATYQITNLMIVVGSIPVTHLPAPEDKQDKIGYTPADDSKVVHSKDMRKPASDVAGIEEVNVKQDKISYTPADDSKVVHENHDGTIQINGHNIYPFDTVQNGYKPYGLDFNNYINSGNYRFDNATTINYPPMATPFYWQLVVFGDGNSVYQIAVGNNITAMRQFFEGSGWGPWRQVADDSKVAHLSGANNFDTIPTYGTGNKPFAINDTGATTARPTGQAVGYQYFDTTLNKPIWYNGSKWVDSTGTTV